MYWLFPGIVSGCGGSLCSSVWLSELVRLSIRFASFKFGNGLAAPGSGVLLPEAIVMGAIGAIGPRARGRRDGSGAEYGLLYLVSCT